MRWIHALLVLVVVSVHAEELKVRVGEDLLKGVPPEVVIGACSAVATDRDDNLFLLQRGQPAVVIFSSDGKYKGAWGRNLFKLAHGLRIDSENNVWATDVDGHTVRKFSAEGTPLLTLGEEGVAGEDEKHFNRPADVAFSPNGDVFVADGYGNSRVVKFDKNGKFVKAWGKKGRGEGEFDLPHNLRFDSKGELYVADRENNRIQVFDQEGRFLRMIGGATFKVSDPVERLPAGFQGARPPGMIPGRVSFSPFGLFITADDTAYITDGRANRVVVMKTDGTLVGTFGKAGTGVGELGLPHGVTVSAKTGKVFVTEVNNKRVQQFEPLAP